MSAEVVVKDLTELPKNIITEVKSQAKPATKDGVVNQAVGFALGIPISMLYDYLYELVAEKAITNDIARDVLKVAIPLGIGVVVQIAKVPYGNIIAGTGYGVAIITLFRIAYKRIKGLLGKGTGTADTGATGAPILEKWSLWGVQT
jgi:hypothetical protein